ELRRKKPEEVVGDSSLEFLWQYGYLPCMNDFNYSVQKDVGLASDFATLGPLRFDIVMKEAIREYPDYNLQNYGEFGGFKSTKDPSQAISSILSLVTAIVSPILMIYLRRLILKTLDRSQQQYAEKTVHSSKMFLQRLLTAAIYWHSYTGGNACKYSIRNR
ncbi:hypothetical protein TELCIR_16124, partial [Teladorsagia circumcincta]